MDNNNNSEIAKMTQNTTNQNQVQEIVQTTISNQPKSSALGITAFVLSIVGFLTGWIYIGIVFDAIAIILAAVALIGIKVSKKNIKKGLAIAALIIAALSIALTGVYLTLLSSLPDTNTKDVENRAYELAVDTFHTNVRLKNESSFTMNSFSTRKIENYNGNKSETFYNITLDYSAQNGFGGFARDTYTVEMVYDKDTDGFKVINAHE